MKLAEFDLMRLYKFEKLLDLAEVLSKKSRMKVEKLREKHGSKKVEKPTS